MKKNIKKYLAIVLAVLFLGEQLAGCVQSEQTEQETKLESRTVDEIELEPYEAEELPPAGERKTCRAEQYEMEITLDTVKQQIRGNSTMTITNQTEDTLGQICVRNYAASILKEKGTGTSTISNARIAGTDQMLVTETKEDSSVIYLQLGERELKPKDTITISLDFVTDIPEQKEKFGYWEEGENRVYQLSFCFPVTAMYENGKWNENPYVFSGESNYHSPAVFRCTFTAPEEYTVAATGEEKTSGKVTEIYAESIRELAVVASDRMKKECVDAEGVEVNHYYLDYKGNTEYNKLSLMAARDSVLLFSRFIGEYPYKELDIVQTALSNGMEFPGLVMAAMPDVENIQKLDQSASYTSACSMIAHETAHQWFYGGVGNDPYEEAWLDEGFAEYCEDVLYQQSRLASAVEAVKRDQERLGSSEIWGTMSDEEFHRDMESQIEQIVGERFIINRTYEQYRQEVDTYSEYVYTGGSCFLYELQNAMGDGKFFSMLQQYYRNWCMKEARTEDFLQAVRAYDNSEEVNQIITKYIA